MMKIGIGNLIVLVFALSCVGTDFITESPLGNPARIEIDPTTTAVQQGSAVSFQATYYDTLGNIVPGTSFQWMSSNPTVASIDESGLAFGKQRGQVMIFASAREVQSESALLTVVSDPNQVARVSLTPDSSDLTIGETLQFIATAFNFNNGAVQGIAFNWSSSDSSIVTIDNNGLATAIAAGVVEIVAEADGVVSLPSHIEVFGRTRTGQFTKAQGTSYTVDGTVTLEELADGSLVLKLGEDFASSNGPGLHVILSTSNALSSGSVDLGDLKFTIGEQSYQVPENVQFTFYDWVIIHCVPFNITFGFAELK